ncbi:tRNA (adenosine(37)-N6)-threonylcarbamoyltransferase complex ATPase subunit type 1 TsaE [Thalassotalea euphylliae]|uniref:tRNA (adenosine(37)-N6)-threonylcarbamoyltransferase complex ATPase subunit type 1 TsaE n=1 Tax=Thalassotalea euphylliae TaxID=1655234 RepID=UPI00362C5AE2
MHKYFLADEQATVDLGGALADLIKNDVKKGFVAFLNGNLGAGKTTLTRGFVNGMGHSGAVKSPTYTLVEPYELADWRIYHFDLYRLADPEELEFMGIRDYFTGNSCSFIEWPEKGEGLLPAPDLVIDLAYENESRIVTFTPNSATGNDLLAQLASKYSGTKV